MKNVNYVAF